MRERPVLIVAETPSLGAAIADLLEAGHIEYRLVRSIEEERPLESLGRRYPVVLAATSGYLCPTARQWLNGDLPHTRLVVVGSRDPAVVDDEKIRRFPLPLDPDRLMGAVRTLVPVG
ncbi:MAG TPA: hypothetical protein VMG14_06410 [Thermoplasmata archaeon]|jgi:hypothetical protein|nr:hypothetical protein [Thermoplasmata archaeon]